MHTDRLSAICKCIYSYTYTYIHLCCCVVDFTNLILNGNRGECGNQHFQALYDYFLFFGFFMSGEYCNKSHPY